MESRFFVDRADVPSLIPHVRECIVLLGGFAALRRVRVLLCEVLILTAEARERWNIRKLLWLPLLLFLLRLVGAFR